MKGENGGELGCACCASPPYPLVCSYPPSLPPHTQASSDPPCPPSPPSGKRLRVMHTTNIASKMPRSFSVQSQGEARVLEYVQVWEGRGRERRRIRIVVHTLPHLCPTLRTSSASSRSCTRTAGRCTSPRATNAGCPSSCAPRCARRRCGKCGEVGGGQMVGEATTGCTILWPPLLLGGCEAVAYLSTLPSSTFPPTLVW